MAINTSAAELVDRVRAELAREGPVRESAMFGGLSFMVREKLAVSVMGGGDLLVRIDAARADELLALKGARPAEMGAGRPMGRGWISIEAGALTAAEDLAFWIEAALECNRRQTGGKKG